MRVSAAVTYISVSAAVTCASEYRCDVTVSGSVTYICEGRCDMCE